MWTTGRVPLSLVCAVFSATALSACTGPTEGPTVAVFAPVNPASPSALAADAATLTRRLQLVGQSSDRATVLGTKVIVAGTHLKIPAADLVKTGHFYIRPVLCGAPTYAPPAKGMSPPTSPLPPCGKYATTAASLDVTTNAGQPANNVPPNPVFAPYPSTINDNPKKTVLLADDPAAGAQQYSRFVLAQASLGATALASASALFDTSIGAWAVSYTLTPSGARSWDQVAKANFHQYVALDLDSLVESAPLIQPNQVVFTSFGGKGEISGNFTAASAKTLAALLDSGPLAAPLHLDSGQ